MVRKSGPSIEHMNVMPNAFKEGKLPTKEINLTPADIERFWKRVGKGAGCWEWAGAMSGSGYGRMYSGGQNFLTHRVSYTIANGPIPEGLSICHKCDNPKCVRPDHLFAGTIHDNNADFIAKSIYINSRITNAKVTLKQVAEMRKMAARGAHPQNIGIKYGLSATQVSQIVAGKSWAWADQSHTPPPKTKWPRHKLTPADVLQIAELFKGGMTVPQIATQLARRERTVRDVCDGTSWSRVTGIERKVKVEKPLESRIAYSMSEKTDAG